MQLDVLKVRFSAFQHRGGDHPFRCEVETLIYRDEWLRYRRVRPGAREVDEGGMDGADCICETKLSSGS